MRAKHQRAIILVVAFTMIGVAAAMILTTFKDNLLFFVTPSQLQTRMAAGEILPTQRLRLGGLVEEGSVTQIAPGEIRFRLTDFSNTQQVRYAGIIPALFREGQGAVVEGAINKEGVFVGKTLLAKHDENYMPTEVAEALKASGKWKAYGTTPSGNASTAPYATGGE
jgi:cytochrome c-type biogenesis protein CcmE